MYESNDKMVSHPQHYQSKSGLEVIDVIEAFTEDLSGIEAVCTANALKYICRWKAKNGVQDVKKAVWYLTRLIERLEEKKDSKESSEVNDRAKGGYSGATGPLPNTYTDQCGRVHLPNTYTDLYGMIHQYFAAGSGIPNATGGAGTIEFKNENEDKEND